mmetsp:Transcript_3190/g.7154  ORF Transcript_3190/g.7154 Transcript_3190/m.7154 type:complete len:358 (+) Transcript_3190:125-1198(+)|eukprot:CAMPEP_0178436692 /NCGR_PEP_ID=MMETSP0689_2-20121128/34572_1 /TAXON_ID=160604 /ORGANISM="Amphidinium massartii, Strain CS-259" /LENGTH=357 /DNA_ID=CAMNT_0020058799 /DNA_START=39 /DNA_END=1112 /DNA_ORIENTATION=+
MARRFHSATVTWSFVILLGLLDDALGRSASVQAQTELPELHHYHHCGDDAAQTASDSCALTLLQHSVQALKPGQQHHLRQCLRSYANGLDAVRPHLGSHIREHPLQVVATSHREVIIGTAPGTSGTKTLRVGLQSLGIQASHHGLNSEAQKEMSRILLGPFNWSTDLKAELAATRRMSHAERDTCEKQVRAFDYTRVTDEAVNDDPLAMLFLELYLTFPRAKFIFSYRPSLDWAERRRGDFPHRDLLPVLEPCGLLHEDVSPHFTIQESARLYDMLYDLVKCVVPPDRLLVYNLWEDPPERTATLLGEIADFLGRPRPEVLSMPHLTGHGSTKVDLSNFSAVEEKSAPHSHFVTEFA